MRLVKKGIDSLYGMLEKNRHLAKMKPVLLAVDEFFFGTGRVTDIAPHIADHMDMKRFMALVVAALTPLTMGAIYFWGWRAAAMILVSYTFGGIAEVAFAVIRKKEIHEGFLVTGLIFPLTLPPTTPLWVAAVGVLFGVIFGKEVFGGTGRNIFNPAIVGRVFLSVAFPKIMTSYWVNPFKDGMGGFAAFKNGVDAVTSATPLAILKNQALMTPYKDLLFGQGAGCLGETLRIAIILGGIFLIALKIVDWRIPLSYLGTVFVLPVVCNYLFHTRFAPPLFQILSGGLLLGAFFMATDPVTSPFTKPGRWIAGVLLGILTVLIRGLSGYVEGVMFSILFVNAFSPLIDTIVLKARYRKR
jgi:RnfABCDGE-type electron transport complex D subunit